MTSAGNTMAARRRSRAVAAGVAASFAIVLLRAQVAVPPTVTFRLYRGGQEIGREVDTLSTTPDGRRLASTVNFNDRGAAVTLTAAVDAGFDWAPRRLLLQGQPFRDTTTDLEVTAAGGQARLREGAATSAVDTGAGLFFPMDGPLPAALHEQLIAFWRSHGRPRQIASTPGRAIEIQARADEQIQIGGRDIRLERLSIDGPAWGRETVWAEPSGNLAALATWLGGVPLQIVREGYDTRLDRFIEQGTRDRLDDLDRRSATTVPIETGSVAFTGATVIVIPGRAPLNDATVVVREGRIAAVGPSARVKPPGGVPVLDARGLTLMPGLWDLDAPMTQVEWAPIYLAAGVTTVRHTSPEPAFSSALQTAIADAPGRLVTPRLLAAGVVDGVDAGAIGSVRAGTVEEGRQAVRRLRNDNFRLIETGRAMSPTVLRAVVEEARRFGAQVAGHIPSGMTAAQARDAGLEFLEGLPDVADGQVPAAELSKLAAEKTPFAPEAAWEELRLGTGSGPGSLRIGAIVLPRSFERVFARPGAAPSAPSVPLAILKAARDAGVRLVPGTGPGLPAFGLIRELQLFVAAGMTPAEALRSATIVPAEVLRAGDSGSVEVGKRADLVLLTASPLDDIGNIGATKWVVSNGNVYDCAALWAAAGLGH